MQNIGNEMQMIIEKLSDIGDDVNIVMPNSNYIGGKKNIISIAGLEGDNVAGLNNDKSRLYTNYRLYIAIKSLSDKPLDKILELFDTLSSRLIQINYKEDTSTITYDEVGVPVVLAYFRARRYN